MSVTKSKHAVDDLEAEAEKAFELASAQQKQNEDDFDFEFESAFQSSSSSFTSFPAEATTKSAGSVFMITSDAQSTSNGPRTLPVKTEAMPSSLPSSQG